MPCDRAGLAHRRRRSRATGTGLSQRMP